LLIIELKDDINLNLRKKQIVLSIILLLGSAIWGIIYAFIFIL